MRVIVVSILLSMAALNPSFGQSLEVIGFDQLEKVLNRSDNTTKVVNFWATWCRPCLMELPHFKEAIAEFEGKDIQFYFVSLDFENNLSKAEQALKVRGFSGNHFLLTGDPNTWIDKIDPDWQGDIPYTLIARKDGRYVKAPYVFESTRQLVDLIRQHE